MILLNLQGEKPTLDFSTSNLDFKEEIIEAYQKSEINFAEHYFFIELSCGSPCYQSFIIDMRDGKVYVGPNAALTFQFQVGENFVITDAPETYEKDDCEICTRRTFIWDEVLKNFMLI